MRRARAAVVLLTAAIWGCTLAAPAAGHDRDAQHSLRAPVTDEDFYFVMADRFENGDTANDQGGLGGDRLVSGFDPTNKGFYNGGDLKGLLERIDYIQGLGTDSIWLTPSFKNKAVQLEDGPSAGYHGYWITDFTQIDPHLGTNADLRGADRRRAPPRDEGLLRHHHQPHRGRHRLRGERPPAPTSARTTRPTRRPPARCSTTATSPAGPRSRRSSPTTSFPYTPVLEPGEENLKVPAWLNDVTLYHNRGDTTFVGEDSLYGDFFGLDDLFTEHPRVVRGMIDVYKTWIRDFGVDGFRIDTMKHVDDEFWQQFGPEVLAYARAHGKREFFMFGEVFDTTKSFTSHFTTHDRMQAVLDFPFQAAAQGFAADAKPADALQGLLRGRRLVHRRRLERLPAADVPREPRHGPDRLLRRARQPRRDATPSWSPATGWRTSSCTSRAATRSSTTATSRASPATGGDQVARQTMFAEPGRPTTSTTTCSAPTRRTRRTTSSPAHPLYRAIAGLAAADASATPRCATARSSTATPSRAAPGVYAFSRIDRREQREYVVALNNAETAKTAAIPTYVGGGRFERIYGDGPRPAAHRPRPAADRDRAAALRGRLRARRADPALASRAVDLARRAGAGRRVARPHGGRAPTSPATRSTR